MFSQLEDINENFKKKDWLHCDDEFDCQLHAYEYEVC